ncbi:MAG: hypothetical protein K9L30_14330 [Desulfobacterales bacterium]|nr:hypothetical protein [Desulfobacterales bacterium]
MSWLEIAINIIIGSGKTILIITVILVPFMIILELIRDARLLDKAAVFIIPLMRMFSLPKEGAFPLLAGVLFGITYGSGIIIPYGRSGELSKRDMTLIGVFLAVCHGMVEDTLIFAAIGAKWWVLVIIRVIFGILAISVAAKISFLKKDQQEKTI